MREDEGRGEIRGRRGRLKRGGLICEGIMERQPEREEGDDTDGDND